jgi:hypothetical protein
MNFTSADLTMVIDEFSDRYIKPAVARLVASVESDALISMRKKVANFVDGDAATFAFSHVASAKRKLDESLADDERYLLLCPQHAHSISVRLRPLTQPLGLQGQYSSGMVKDFNGFSIDSTTHLTPHQTGTAVATSCTPSTAQRSPARPSPSRRVRPRSSRAML